MRWLIACERSGLIRSALRKRGHEAYSCDLEPADDHGEHLQGDALSFLGLGWDGLIAHPPCTRLCNSGVRWLAERNLWADMREAALFFRALLDADIPSICIENPIPHRYALEVIGRKYDQIIQPWQFGHGETKATCLWLKNLDFLKPTEIVLAREHRIWRMGPSPERSRLRSLTYQGIADAMSNQWG